MFARIFKIALGDNHELYKKYSQLQTDLNSLLIEKETGKNTLNKYEKDKYIDFDNLLKIRQDLEDVPILIDEAINLDFENELFYAMHKPKFKLFWSIQQSMHTCVP